MVSIEAPDRTDAALPPAERVARLDWDALGRSLDEHGAATVRGLLALADRSALQAMYPDRAMFRSRIVMARHAYGRGEYQYFAAPLPPLVSELRGALYVPLAAIANRWAAALGEAERFPPTHDAFLERCHADGQTRPTPLLLRYQAGDYNRLHQDLYGAHVFPLQVAILLSEPCRDFRGGEFVLTEQRPRMQSRVEVVPLSAGDAVIFPVHHRPVRAARGMARATMRHGVSRLHAGERYTLGIIFHDAA